MAATKSSEGLFEAPAHSAFRASTGSVRPARTAGTTLAATTASWILFMGLYGDFPRIGAGVHFAAAAFYLITARLTVFGESTLPVASAGERELAPLRGFGTPLEDGIGIQDYMVMQTQEDVSFGHGIRSYAKNGMVREITPELIDAMVESFVADPRLAFFTHTAGGAVKRVDELATAFPHRNAETMIIVAGGWTDPAQDDDAMATARAWFSNLEPFTGGYYDNIEFEGEAAAGNYGPAYSRLRSVKAEYDPTNLFRLNSNVLPAG